LPWGVEWILKPERCKMWWKTWIEIFAKRLDRMLPHEQKDLVDKFAMIAVVGIVLILILAFYPTIPRLWRILFLPMLILLCWSSRGKFFK
jgi:hypothetical protein